MGRSCIMKCSNYFFRRRSFYVLVLLSFECLQLSETFHPYITWIISFTSHSKAGFDETEGYACRTWATKRSEQQTSGKDDQNIFQDIDFLRCTIK